MGETMNYKKGLFNSGRKQRRHKRSFRHPRYTKMRFKSKIINPNILKNSQSITIPLNKRTRLSAGLRQGMPYAQVQYDVSEKTTAMLETSPIDGKKLN